MTEEQPSFDLGRGKVELDEAIELAEVADNSPERLLLRVDGIVDELMETSDADVEELLLMTLLRVTRYAPEECVPLADTVANYVDDDRSTVREYAVALLEELSKADPEALSDYVPAMAAASNSEDDLTEFFATEYLANVAKYRPNMMTDMREVLLRRVASDDVDTGNAALAAFESVVGIYPKLAAEIRPVLKNGLSHNDESRRLATAGVVREAVRTEPQNLDVLSEEVKSILNDSSPDVREIGIATFVDLWKEDSLHHVTDKEFREPLGRACEMNGMGTENKSKLLNAIG